MVVTRSIMHGTNSNGKLLHLTVPSNTQRGSKFI